MAHSQFIRFMVPSAFLVGTATKPCVINVNPPPQNITLNVAKVSTNGKHEMFLANK